MLTYANSKFSSIFKAHYGFTLIFLLFFSIQRISANDVGFALHFGTYPYYSYTHPGQIDLNVKYLVDLFLDGEQA
ncbi:MAG: hypothetical protein AAFV80_24125, partial [Bacteroidota bacterium]